MRRICILCKLLLIVVLLGSVALVQADALVVSRNNNSIVIFDASGQYVSTVALPSETSTPADIAQAPNGEIFVLRSGGLIQRFDAALNYISSWSAGSRQYGINVDSTGLVYVAGSGSTSVGVFNASGALQTTLTPSGGSNLRDTVQVGTDTWVSNFAGPKLDVMDSGGADIGDIPSPDAPFGMQLAPNGDVWVVAQNTHEVRRTNPGGTQVFTFNADNGPSGAITGQLRYLGVGADGSVYIPHRDSNIVDVYNDTGGFLFTLTDTTLDGAEGILVTGSFNAPAPATPIPTLSWWGLTSMFLILLGIGGSIIRRRTWSQSTAS